MVYNGGSVEPPGNLSSEPEILVTVSGNPSSHEPTDLFFPVTVSSMACAPCEA